MAVDNQEPQIIINLSTDPQKFQDELKKVDAIAEKFSTDTGKKVSKNINEGVSSLGGSLTKIFAGAAAAFAGAFTIGKIISETKKEEEAISRLNSALIASGQYTAQVSQDFQEYASSIQKVTRYGNDAVLSAGALVNQLTKLSGDGLKQATSASVELAAKLGVDLQVAAMAVSKGIEGNNMALGRYGIKIGEVSGEAERLKAIVEKIGQGTAEARALSFFGQLDQINNSFGDLLETFGKAVTRSPMVVASMKLVKEAIEGITGTLEKQGGAGLIDSFISGLLDIGVAITEYVIPPFELLYNIGRVVFNGIVSFLDIAVASFGRLGLGIAKILEFSGIKNDLTQGLKDFADSSAQVAIEQVQAVKDSVDSMLNFSASDRLNQMAASASEQIKQTASTVAQPLSDMTQTEMAKTNEVVVKYGALMQQSLTSAISGSVQLMTKNLMGGQGAFKDWAKFALNMMGDFAIKMGEMIIMTALSIDALQKSLMTFGGAGLAIAAGVGLIIVGTALKSFAGGPEATGGTASGAGVGGGLSAPTNQPDNFEQAGPSTMVNVTIQGDVLDSQESGSRIVKLISENFEKTGQTVVQGAMA